MAEIVNKEGLERRFENEIEEMVVKRDCKEQQDL